MTAYPNDIKSSNHISPTPAAKKPATYGLSKENKPSRLSPTVGLRQRHSMATSHIYPSQVFYDPILNPLYDSAFARSFSTYGGQQPGYNEDLKPPPPRLHSTPHEQFRPIHPTPRPSGQQRYGAGTRNNGQSMHYGV